MIAPLRKSTARESASVEDEPLEVARRIVAATLLPRTDGDRGPRIPAWQAWLFAGWMAIAAIFYGLSMAGMELF